MAINEFDHLPINEQAEEVWKNGVFVADRIQNYYKFMLYQLHAFMSKYGTKVVKSD